MRQKANRTPGKDSNNRQASSDAGSSISSSDMTIWLGSTGLSTQSAKGQASRSDASLASLQVSEAAWDGVPL